MSWSPPTPSSTGSPRAGGPRPAYRRDARGSSGVGVRGSALHAGRDERGGRPPPGDAMASSRSASTRCGPGCYDVDARVHDMDINGVWASVNFPSMITGFCGRVFFDAKDRDLGLACVKAWNDWLFEEWYSAPPRPHRPARDHLPGRSGAGGRRNPPQRRTRLHVGDVPRAAARNRVALAVGPGALGPDHGGRGRDRHRGLPPRRQLGPDPGAARERVWTPCSSAPPSSASCRSSPAPSGCGPATPSGCPRSRSP